jgi:hypothetical protein
LQTYVSVWLPITLADEGMSATQVGLALRDVGIVSVFIISVAWGLILVALFGWRPAHPTSPQSSLRSP